MPGTIDLHLHTFFSDGTDSPERVVTLAHEVGHAAIAITDHDNIDALPVAQPVADRLGLELIPGIEMSASADNTEVHILGFLFDVTNAPLLAHLKEQQARRVQRVHEMCEKLSQVGIRIRAQDVLDLAGQGTVGRPHVARILQKHGYVTTLAEAFQKFIGPDNPGFVPGSPIAPGKIIGLLRGAGGIPVLAHAVYLKNDALIERFAREGLVGLEVFHPGHMPDKVRHYEQLADRLGLLKTGGSDSHGNAKEGAPIGAVKPPYALLEALRSWQAAQHA
jgi:predicted metal-dependent phosphoesterase TrpH